MEILKATGNNGIVFSMSIDCSVLDDLKDSNAKLIEAGDGLLTALRVAVEAFNDKTCGIGDEQIIFAAKERWELLAKDGS